MSILHGIGIGFEETMAGYLGVGATDPTNGYMAGRNANTPIQFSVKIHIDDLEKFTQLGQHKARLDGTVTFGPLGGTSPIENGEFFLFAVDGATGNRQMVYRFQFKDSTKRVHYLHGVKQVVHQKGELDVVEDMTRLFTKVYEGPDESGKLYGAGELYFNLKDSLSLIGSMKTVGAQTVWQEVAAYAAFTSFAYGTLRDEYLRNLNLFYDTRYESLTVSGEVELGEPKSERCRCFLVSGAHDKGFPWGGTELFWDVLLVLGNDDQGYRKYAITDRVLSGLDFDVDHGRYRYHGPIFQLPDDGKASFSQMRKADARLTPLTIDIDLQLKTVEHDAVDFPFPIANKLARRLTSAISKAIFQALPSEKPLGYQVTPKHITVSGGRISITDGRGKTLVATMDGAASFGEAELGTLRNSKEPTLFFHALNALSTAEKTSVAQVFTGTLRDKKTHWVKDHVDAYLGTIISRTASAQITTKASDASVEHLERHGSSFRPELLEADGEPLLEIRNDHLQPAVYLRRIVWTRLPSGERALASESAMELLRLEAINSDRKTTVAAIKDNDPSKALAQVLKATGFDEKLEKARAASGKPKDKFAVVIKPNFMFSYNKADRSSYTDPELVKQLARHLRDLGFTNLAVVEAQSTYGEYFDKRSVAEMADYLGFTADSLYRVVDMTLEACDDRHFGPHLGQHPLSPTWRDADFRISFAKNKTHAYAYYTLTLKNIYGTLVKANKFKEYHCDRDIYYTTMEYLQAFPVHFGLVDGYLSADGPFGVFADPSPNPTHTIVGGENLVAVDWVTATKMGVDPTISKYMELAVATFGKPEIEVIGDRMPFRPWLNVPPVLALFTNRGVDASYHFGNLFYASAAQMDDAHFTFKSRNPFILFLRKLTNPIRRAIFVRTNENPTLLNRLLSRLFYWLGF